MKIIQDVPDAFYRYILKTIREPKPGVFHVTDLSKPTQMTVLIWQHWNDIEILASSRVKTLMGQALHYILATNAPSHHLVEERLEMLVNEAVVVGSPDVWYEPANLRDWKATSVYSFLLGDKPEWIAQQNLYAVLWREIGFPVWQIHIDAYLDDWKRARAAHEANYPASNLIEVALPVWEPLAARVYLFNRVNALKQGLLGLYPPCSPEERWAKPDTWAVKKRGNKQALRLPGQKSVLPTLEAAEALVTSLNTGTTEIEFRPGISTRCELWCDARSICPQWASIKTKQDENKDRKTGEEDQECKD